LALGGVDGDGRDSSGGGDVNGVWPTAGDASHGPAALPKATVGLSSKLNQVA
jgi:hypothetical protein